MLFAMHAVLLSALMLVSSAMPNTTGKICQWGCFDEEDEACHAGLTNMQCAEIYGHLCREQKKLLNLVGIHHVRAACFMTL